MKSACLLAAALAAIACLPPVAGRAAESSKPNFVVILIDDMGYGDIGPYGSKLNRTPHLDHMAREGMKLTSFYAAPVCTPSRAQMMTGCYAKRVSLPNVIFPACPIGISAKEHTVAELLKQQGYATMAIGKWHLGDQPDFLPTRHGFDHYLGLPYSNDMGGPARTPRARRPPLPLVRDGDRDRGARRSRHAHGALYPGSREIHHTPTRTGRSSCTFRIPPYTCRCIPARTSRANRPTAPTATGSRKWTGVSAGCWTRSRELKLAERTFVLFTSDNGPWLTQGRNGGIAGPLHGGKGTTWEGGMREPTIAWWPGRIAAGTVCDAAMSEMDVLPTLVKLAGGKVPADRKIDGKDVWPLLAGQTQRVAA